MSKKTFLFGISLFLGILFSITSAKVTAHSPTNLVLEYNANTQSLNATFTHNVDTTDHYIKTVLITVNGSSVPNIPYTSQPSNTFTYNYTITANAGAIISVKGTCSRSGSITRTFTVGIGQNEAPGENAISGYFGIIIITGVFLGGFTILFKKKLKK